MTKRSTLMQLKQGKFFFSTCPASKNNPTTWLRNAVNRRLPVTSSSSTVVRRLLLLQARKARNDNAEHDDVDAVLNQEIFRAGASRGRHVSRAKSTLACLPACLPCRVLVSQILHYYYYYYHCAIIDTVVYGRTNCRPEVSAACFRLLRVSPSMELNYVLGFAQRTQQKKRKKTMSSSTLSRHQQLRPSPSSGNPVCKRRKSGQNVLGEVGERERRIERGGRSTGSSRPHDSPHTHVECPPIVSVQQQQPSRYTHHIYAQQTVFFSVGGQNSN
ncbi:uncharacterized protein IWZ02DRAFT_27188 [Phyllosticta citriasiana]|uniref:uncharacterized protein n=1 Tax=Phyllosticta citriasiana TaxID=595635 RepID=UPI0030FDB089